MKSPRYKALIFDMDGTITLPILDFGIIRKEIGLPEGDIAHEITKLSPEKQMQAWSIIEQHEQHAAANQELQPGTQAFLSRCRDANIRLGLITRNIQRSVDALCETFNLEFDFVITREFPHIKPHPAPILHMLKQWNIAAEDALMIGDYIHDIECGIAAGTETCFFMNPNSRDYGTHANFTVHSMTELEARVSAPSRTWLPSDPDSSNSSRR